MEERSRWDFIISSSERCEMFEKPFKYRAERETFPGQVNLGRVTIILHRTPP